VTSVLRNDLADGTLTLAVATSKKQKKKKGSQRKEKSKDATRDRISEFKIAEVGKPCTDDDLIENGSLHEVIQRDLRCIYEEDSLLKYIFTRAARKRIDMVFCKGENETSCKDSQLFIFRINSELLDKSYCRVLPVCHTDDERETKIETLCVMMFQIKSELAWSEEGRKIVTRSKPLDMTFPQLVTLNLIRAALNIGEKQLRGARRVELWKAALILDISRAMSDFPVEGRTFRILLTNLNNNCEGAIVTITFEDDRDEEVHDVSFGDRKEGVFRWVYVKYAMKQKIYVSVELKNKIPVGQTVRVSIDFAE
jgi:hypothetical protein